LQDTIPICPPILSQHVALASAAMGRAWVQQQLGDVQENKTQLRSMLTQVLGEANVYGGEGAIYLMARLPSAASGAPADDVEAVRMLARDEGVVVIPGSSCGAPGFVRVAYANLPRAKCDEAIGRLRKGLARLASV
jgi:aspartate/methionine/tyrosine aminotransferase